MLRFSLGLALFSLQAVAAFALDPPKLQGRINDLAGILTPDQISKLESKLEELERTDSTQVAVLIIPSLEGDPLEDFSMRVAEAWKIGQKGKDNGAILLLSMKDRAIRIEAGYGLESTLTDARSSRIIRNEIAPRFRAGDFYGGIDAGVTGIIDTVRGVYQGSPPSQGPSASDRSPRNLLNFLIMLLFPLLWILSATGKWGGGILGAAAGMLLPYTLAKASLPFILVGGVAGSFLGIILGAIVRAGAKSSGGTRGGFGGPFWGSGGGGGFGGSSGGGGGFGGFSGGGGGFGGGGSSGRW